MKKKVNRRNRSAKAGLDPNLNLKIRHDELDFDYLHKLAPEELDFLNRFAEETIHGNFDHEGKKLYRKKSERQELWRKNNKRNVDSYSFTKAAHMLVLDGEKAVREGIEAKRVKNINCQEDTMIEIIDSVKIRPKTLRRAKVKEPR